MILLAVLLQDIRPILGTPLLSLPSARSIYYCPCTHRFYLPLGSRFAIAHIYSYFLVYPIRVNVPGNDGKQYREE
jgi:hypothetical protein